MRDFMKVRILIFLAFALITLSGCQAEKPGCPLAGAVGNYLTTPPDALPAQAASSSKPIEMKIRGRNITVDRIVEGPLCNGSWAGTIYVTCSVQVYAWVDKPLFLKDCNLSISPDSVVYVAYHNDTAYYKGCSCHTGEIEEP
jgi:hypothetical protein